MSKGITQDMPADCVLISARDIRVGDTVRHRVPTYDFTVEEIEGTESGPRFRWGNDTASCVCHPGELFWVTRRVRS